MRRYEFSRASDLYEKGDYEALYQYCLPFKRNRFALGMLILACDGTRRLQERNSAYQRLLDLLNQKLADAVDPGEIYHALSHLYGDEDAPFYNLQEQFLCLEKAYGSGCDAALWEYVRCLAMGIGCLQDPRQAYQVAQDAAARDPDLEVVLGILYDYGIGVNRDRRKAVVIYQNHIKSRKKEARDLARACLGVCYFYGDGVPRDPQKALELFQSVPNDTVAKKYCDLLLLPEAKTFYELGCCYLLGGISYLMQDAVRGRNMLEEACIRAKQDPYLSALGECYLTGRGGSQDFQKARHLFQASGSEVARVYLGVMDFHGFSGPKDIARAVRAFQQGASQGISLAVFYMAICYLEGTGVQENRAEARKLLRNYRTKCNDLYSIHCRGLAALLTLEAPPSFQEKEAALHEIEILAAIHPTWFAWKDQLLSDAPPDSISRFIKILCTEVQQTFTKGEWSTASTLVDKISRGIQRTRVYIEAFCAVQKMAAETPADKAARIAVLQNDQILKNQKRIESKIDALQTALETSLPAAKRELEKELQKAATPEAKEQKVSLFGECASVMLYQSVQQSGQASIKQAEHHLQQQFGGYWKRLKKGSRDALLSAAVIWNRCADIDYSCFDFSGVCITACTALERELRKYFFNDFQEFLVENNVPLDKWPDVLQYHNERKQEFKRSTNFTMGKLPYLFAYTNGEGSFVSTKNRNRSENDETEITRTNLGRYLASKCVGLQEGEDPLAVFEAKKYKGRSFIDRCETIREKYRNTAAHGMTIIKKEDAASCYCEIIGRDEAMCDQEEVVGLLLELMKAFY